MGNEITYLKSEMILRLALAEQLEQDPEILAFLPECEQKERHIFSPAHEKKMRKIFRMAKRAEHRMERRKSMLRAAVCIVVFFGVSTVTVSSVDAVRIPILSYITDVKEKATQYRITKRENVPLTKVFAEHEPTYVPEGFFVEDVIENKDYFTILYTNGTTGLWYEIRYCADPLTISIDTENAQSRETKVNQNKTIVVDKNGKLRATMYMNNAHVVILGTLSWNETQKVLQSVK